MDILAIIPARSGSKRVPNKNIRDFAGKPLVAHSIEHALGCNLINRVIVDTDSKKIAEIATKYGAEVPYLRPKELAEDESDVNESLLNLLERLREDERYEPDYFVLLQPTSPLREVEDIEKCIRKIRERGAPSVLTVTSTHPMLFHLSKNSELVFANGSINERVGRTQDWPRAYVLNGCTVYVVETSMYLKKKKIITDKTQAITMPKWRSIDIDEPEDWVLAEFIFKNKKEIETAVVELSQ